MAFAPVPTFLDSEPGAIGHAGREAILLHRGPFLGPGEVDGGDSHLLGGFAKLVERNFVVAPAADGVVDVSFAFNGAIGREIAELKNSRASRDGGGSGLDRKSTRLNSSHVSISYAVFCLK